MVSYFAFLSLALMPFVLSYSPLDGSGERELRRDLFAGYDKNTRPVKRYSTAVPVSISMTPLSVHDLDEYKQILNLDSWIFMTWADEYLVWNPEDYDGITELRVSPSQIWRPDIALYTGSPDTALFPTVETNAIVYNNGSVMWVPPFTIHSRCPMPQSLNTVSKKAVTCNIKMGSWTFSIKMIDLKLASDKVDLSNFLDFNQHWKLEKVDSNREVKFYDCCAEGYPNVNFNVTLKRRSKSLNFEHGDSLL